MWKIHFYCESNGKVPALDFLRELKISDKKGYVNCLSKIELLEEYGYKLERPHAAYLRDKIYELRVRSFHSQYRILYFFYKQNAIILTHGMVKKVRKVSPQDIGSAVLKMCQFLENPDLHTSKEKVNVERND